MIDYEILGTLFILVTKTVKSQGGIKPKAEFASLMDWRWALGHMFGTPALKANKDIKTFLLSRS